jgi:transposase
MPSSAYCSSAGRRASASPDARSNRSWLLAELGFELWIGDPVQIKAKRVRKQKTDRLDAELLLQLLLEDRFPRVWVPSAENRDLRQLLWHRHRLVQMRTRMMNQLQAVAMNEGVRRKQGLWSKSGRAQLEFAFRFGMALFPVTNLPLSSASEELPPLLDMAPLIRAPEGLEPS